VTGTPVQSRGERWLPRIGAAAAALTTLCCLGVTAAVSLATAVGATFLTEDSTLRPLLIVTLAVTAVGCALTFWRHRNPGPLLLTVAAAVWIYAFVYVVATSGHPDHDAPDHAAAAHGAFTSEHRMVIWLGLGVLVAAQLWDVTRVRRARQSQHLPLATTAATR